MMNRPGQPARGAVPLGYGPAINNRMAQPSSMVGRLPNGRVGGNPPGWNTSPFPQMQQPARPPSTSFPGTNTQAIHPQPGSSQQLDPSEFPALGGTGPGSMQSPGPSQSYAFTAGTGTPDQRQRQVMPAQDDFPALPTGLTSGSAVQPQRHANGAGFADASPPPGLPGQLRQPGMPTQMDRDQHRNALLGAMTGAANLKGESNTAFTQEDAKQLPIDTPANAQMSHQTPPMAHVPIGFESSPSAKSSQLGPIGAPPMMDGDQYGLKGLLGVIRMENQDLSMLALGNDLTSLGLNMNQSDDRPLYASFNSPWMETNNKDVEPVYHLPACYNVQPPPPAHTKIQSFSDETLFYIFYSMPRDVMQEYAAAELTARNWRYHKELRMWLTKDPNAEPNLKTTAYERGEYVFFDHLHWEKIRKEFVLVYEALENRPFSINGATPSMESPSAVQAQLAGTPAPGHAAPSLPNGF